MIVADPMLAAVIAFVIVSDGFTAAFDTKPVLVARNSVLNHPKRFLIDEAYIFEETSFLSDVKE